VQKKREVRAFSFPLETIKKRLADTGDVLTWSQPPGRAGCCALTRDFCIRKKMLVRWK